jgi:ribosomal subunit interface protein
MDIRVSGHQVDIGEAFKAHAAGRMQGIADKLFSRAVAANVTLGHGPHDNGFVCDVFMPLQQGLVIKASGRSPEAHQAFDQAADKIEKQLRRYMRRLKDRHSPSAGNGSGARPDASYQFNAGYTVFRGDEPQAEAEAADNPIVVAETKADIPECAASDAVMMLDLRNTTALMFRNSKTGQYNMVYRREDGNIGWVEPH